MMLIAQLLMLLLQGPTPGVLTGRVLYPSGDPVAGAQVELMHYEYKSHASLGALSDHPELWTFKAAIMNDRGEYRFFDVPPGKYFLRVTSPDFSPFGAKFYPGVEGLTKAEPIEIRASQEMRLNDIVLSRTTLQPIRVRATGRGLRASLYGGPAPDQPPATLGFLDGLPAIRPDEPGDYKVCATALVDGVARNACTDVVYTGAAMEVALTIPAPQAYLTGQVMPPLAGITIGAIGAGPGSNFGATSGPDGFFKSLSTVQEGPAKLRQFLNVPEGFYIASVRQGTRDALTNGILITTEDTNLDVRVVKSSSVVQGQVTGGSGSRTVVLLPQGALVLRTDKENTHRLATTNANGTFEIRNVIPGTYRAFAFASIQRGSHLDAAAFRSYSKLGTPVEIARDSTVSLELLLRALLP